MEMPSLGSSVRCCFFPSLLQFQDQEHSFICNLMSTQSAQITPVVVFSNALLREEALQSEAHLAKHRNVGRGGRSLKASLVQPCSIKIFTTSIKYTQIVYSLSSSLAALLWFLNRIWLMLKIIQYMNSVFWIVFSRSKAIIAVIE